MNQGKGVQDKMPNILKLNKLDKKTHKLRNVGSIEIRNQTEDTAELYFYGDINSESLGEWQKYYPDDKAPADVQEFLNQLDNVNELQIHINSGGGSVFGGIAIFNILKTHKAKKSVYVDGIAASIASVIMCAASSPQDIHIPANAMVMIHKPLSWCSGNANDMRKEADVLDECQKLILNTYMQITKEGVTEEQINALIDSETWKNGKDWQEYFDVTVESENKAAACASDYFDKYENLPDGLKNDTPQNTDIDLDLLADKVTERMMQALKNQSPEDTEELEKKKSAILEDLDLI